MNKVKITGTENESISFIEVCRLLRVMLSTPVMCYSLCVVERTMILSMSFRLWACACTPFIAVR